VDHNELQKWHDQVEEQLARCRLHHISYSVDGVSIERGLGHDLHSEALMSNQTHTWSFPHPVAGQLKLTLIVPILTNGKPFIPCTDGKHLKKNG
jgi:hypothetical protein